MYSPIHSASRCFRANIRLREIEWCFCFFRTSGWISRSWMRPCPAEWPPRRRPGGASEGLKWPDFAIAECSPHYKTHWVVTTMLRMSAALPKSVLPKLCTRKGAWIATAFLGWCFMIWSSFPRLRYVIDENNTSSPRFHDFYCDDLASSVFGYFCSGISTGFLISLLLLFYSQQHAELFLTTERSGFLTIEWYLN